MNYRHIYHAGYFADVFKHLLLVELTQSFLAKDKPFCYLDTHAGIGCYDLQHPSAQKTQEYEHGILKLLQSCEPRPEAINRYLALVEQFNDDKGSEIFQYYPGSPRFVRYLLRNEDRMILVELHPEDYMTLKSEFSQDKQVVIHHYDAYQALKAFLPPKQGRGLVLIDPPFEKLNDFSQIVAGLKLGLQRWAGGCFAVWFPIKDLAKIAAFSQELKSSGLREILYCELTVPPIATTNLHACGMVVIHPPWHFKENIEKVLPWLCDALSQPGKGEWKINWLVGE